MEAKGTKKKGFGWGKGGPVVAKRKSQMTQGLKRGYLCIHCTTPLYIRDLSIRWFWYTQGLLEPIPQILRDKCTLDSTYRHHWKVVKTKKPVCNGLHNEPLVGREREVEKVEAESSSRTFRSSVPLHPSLCCYIRLDLDMYVDNPTT